jgi:alpha-amylase
MSSLRLLFPTMVLILLPLGSPAQACGPPLSPHPVEGGILFSYRPEKAIQSVCLAGDFNDWDIVATPMADQDEDGIWTVVFPLSRGQWEYKFVVDGGIWVTDPNAPDVNYQNFNNGIVYVGLEQPPDTRIRRSDLPWVGDRELAPHPVEGGVLFSYQALEGTRSVNLAGEFNGWSMTATPMADDDGDGLWRIWYPLRPGRYYEYKFVVDGSQWVTDPNAPETNPSNYNNAVVYVAEPGVPYAIMTFPKNRSRSQESVPISGHLLCHGDEVDPTSVRVKLGETDLPHEYNPEMGQFTAELPEDLPDLDYRLIISARGHNSGKLGETQVEFTMDRELAIFDSPDFFDRAVIYEIFVRSFKDSDGDNIGDLNGVNQMLDYLNDGDPKTTDDLGIDAIWMMPLCQSPSYHGYDITDYYSIEEDYGTNEDLFKLCREAHRRGIRIIFDLVINHCSSKHPFFADALGNANSPYSEWFKFLDPQQTEYEAFSGYKGMPELNFDSRPMRDYLLEMAKYWMDPNGDGDFSDGVDGYRLDVGKGPPHDWWKELRRELKQVRPDFLLLGEVWDTVETIHGYFDYEFDMQFDYPAYYGLLQFLNNGHKYILTSTLREEKNKFPAQAQLCRFLDNHDNDRILSVVKNSLQRNKLGALILFTLPGTPMVYYGEELGMRGVNPPDEAVRTPMEWDLVAQQRPDHKSLLNWYAQLIRVRAHYPALSARDDRDMASYRVFRIGHEQVYAYLRFVEGSDPFIVVVNLSDMPVERYHIQGSTLIDPGRYAVTDLLSQGTDRECSVLRVNEEGRIVRYRPKLQLEPETGYLLKLERLPEKTGFRDG